MLASIKSKLKTPIQSIRRFSRKDRMIEEQAKEEAQQRIKRRLPFVSIALTGGSVAIYYCW